MPSEHQPYLISQIAPLLELAKDHYYQLLLIIGGSCRERTLFLKEIASHYEYAYIALGLPLRRSEVDQIGQLIRIRIQKKGLTRAIRDFQTVYPPTKVTFLSISTALKLDKIIREIQFLLHNWIGVTICARS